MEISKQGARAATVNNKLATLLDKSINYPAVKVELVSEVKESAKTKMLGAIVSFPGVAEQDGTVIDKKHYVSFDNLFTTSDKDLFSKFYDNTKAMFLGITKLGVRAGQPFLVQA